MSENSSATRLVYTRLFFWLIAIFGIAAFALLLTSGATQFLYFARVPLVSLTLFAGVVPFLAIHNLKSLLIGTYDLIGFQDGTSGNVRGLGAGVALGLVLVLCGMTIYTTATLGIELGPVRANGEPPVTVALWEKWIFGLIIWIGIFLNIALVCTASTTGGFSRAKLAIVGLVVGIAAAALLWSVIESFVRSLHGSLSQAATDHPWLVPIRTLSESLQNWQNWSHHDWLRGYISSANTTDAPELKHLGALIFLFISLALYILLRGSYLVPVVYLLLLVIVSTWMLSALSFLLDYFHLPILVPLGLWLLLVSLHPKADHYYRILRSDPAGQPDLNSKLTPGQIVRRSVNKKEPIVLVAAAGGGIQATAWTAQVLTSLEKHCLEKQSLNPRRARFCEAVKLLSGVSGGSVGNMFFASAYQNGSIPQDVLDRITEAAFSSGLSQAAKGFAYSDLHRAVFPFRVRNVYRDRGQALEQAWMVNAGCRAQGHLKDAAKALCNTLDKATLKGWQNDVVSDKRPAVIFNATTVESGKRLAFSTSPYKPKPPVNPDAPSSVIDFSSEYADANVLISTAVRLSSTFTYVSPAARPLPAYSLDDRANCSVDLYTSLSSSDPMRLHVVDGGYYENTGLGALVAWLNQALVELDKQNLPKRILVITIGAFPPNENPKYGGRRGAIFQFEAPFLTLESLQGQEHPSGAWRELQLLIDRLYSLGTELIPVDFTFPLGQPPLSWHLRDCDKKNITTGWDRLPQRQENLSRVDQFFEHAP